MKLTQWLFIQQVSIEDHCVLQHLMSTSPPTPVAFIKALVRMVVIEWRTSGSVRAMGSISS